MSILPDDELLSAYLDGELSPDERVRAERLLAESENARQKLEELRAMSSSLAALPKRKLPVDFCEETLRLAERRKTEGATERVVPSFVERWQTRWKEPRSWLWLGVVASAAILVAVFSPQWEDLSQYKVAKGPSSSAMRARSDVSDAESVADEKVSVRLIEPTGDAPKAPPSLVAKDSNRQQFDEPKRAAKSEDDFAESDSLRSEVAANEKKRAKDAESANSPVKQEERHYAKTASPKPLAAPALAAQLQPNFLDSKSKELASSAGTEVAAVPYQKTKNAWAFEIPPDTLVVEFDMTPEAAKKQVFDKLLTSNGFVFETVASGDKESREELTAKNSSAGGSDLALAKAPSVGNVDAAQNRSSTAEERGLGIGGRLAFGGKKKADVEPEAVYVEADPVQLENAINSMSAQQDAFSNVQIKTARTADMRQNQIAENIRQNVVQSRNQSQQTDSLSFQPQIVAANGSASNVGSTTNGSNAMNNAAANNAAAQSRARRIPIGVGQSIDVQSMSNVGFGGQNQTQLPQQNSAVQSGMQAQGRAQHQMQNQSGMTQRAVFIPRVVEPAKQAPAATKPQSSPAENNR